MIEQESVAWAAGLLEGEGCFSLHKRKGKDHYSFAIHCEMTDEDVVRKIHSVFNVGSVNLRLNMSGRRDTRNRKQTWIWSVQNKAGIKMVLELIRPYMGTRRGEKIDLLLKELNESIRNERRVRRPHGERQQRCKRSTSVV